MLMLNSVLILK